MDKQSFENIKDKLELIKKDYQNFNNTVASNSKFIEFIKKNYFTKFFYYYYLTTLYCEDKIIKNIRFNLDFNYKPKKIKKIKLPSELQIDYLPDNLEQKKDTIIDAEIEKFLNCLKGNFKEEDLKGFYYNIASLDVTQKEHLYNALGVYDYDKNEIKLLEENKLGTIFHELFHMSSSYKDQNKNITYCGFEINTQSYKLGRGINEGYTSLLAERYSNESCYSYPMEKTCAEFIESILGRQLMESLYMRGNLRGLVNELEKFANYNEIMQFISSLDAINKLESNETLIHVNKEAFKEMYLFIRDFLNKLYLKYYKFNLKDSRPNLKQIFSLKREIMILDMKLTNHAKIYQKVKIDELSDEEIDEYIQKYLYEKEITR